MFVSFLRESPAARGFQLVVQELEVEWSSGVRTPRLNIKRKEAGIDGGVRLWLFPMAATDPQVLALAAQITESREQDIALLLLKLKGN